MATGKFVPQYRSRQHLVGEKEKKEMLEINKSRESDAKTLEAFE